MHISLALTMCVCVCVVGSLLCAFGSEWGGVGSGWLPAWLVRPCQSACLLISRSATHKKRHRFVSLLFPSFSHFLWLSERDTHRKRERERLVEGEMHVNSACTVLGRPVFCIVKSLACNGRYMCMSVCVCARVGIYDCAVNMPAGVSTAAIAKS